MHWEEQEDTGQFQVPDDVQDLSFQFNCRELPVDHAWLLANAILGALPWIAKEKAASVHSIHGAASGNGWTRPTESAGSMLQLSRRTRLYLRLPKHRINEASGLAGSTLDLGDYRVKLGQARPRSLIASSTVFTRSWYSECAENEETFTREVLATLDNMGITARKVLCGLSHKIFRPDATLTARSVLLADLDVGEAVHLQQAGIGSEKLMGCGIFLPHKSLAAVGASQETS